MACGCQCMCPTNQDYGGQKSPNHSSMFSAQLATKSGSNLKSFMKLLKKEGLKIVK